MDKALKVTRPKGWGFYFYQYPNGFVCVGKKYLFEKGKENDVIKANQLPCVSSEPFATEKLAELHAVIQAIDYDRKIDLNCV
jgi:hypothetical protein